MPKFSFKFVLMRGIKMNQSDIISSFNAIKDEEYKAFNAKLLPTIDSDSIIGVRLPEVRKIAKDLIKDYRQVEEFMIALPHKYYEENLLHSALIALIKDYDLCMQEIEKFLPYVDNWAVCDCMSPKVFAKNTDKLLRKIKNWIASKEVYTCRYGIGMLMRYFLDENFKPDYVMLVSSVKSDEYYINMMIAWFYATALAKQWDDTIFIVENKVLDKWIHNKTIQKAVESRRISQDKKTYLKELKIK